MVEFNTIVFAYIKEDTLVFCRILTSDGISIEKKLEEVFAIESVKTKCAPSTIKIYVLTNIIQGDNRLLAYVATVFGKDKPSFLDDFFGLLEDPVKIEHMFLSVRKMADTIVFGEDIKKKLY